MGRAAFVKMTGSILCVFMLAAAKGIIRSEDEIPIRLHEDHVAALQVHTAVRSASSVGETALSDTWQYSVGGDNKAAALYTNAAAPVSAAEAPAPVAEASSRSKRLHYVMTTDCTANSLWMGHVHIALLDLQQPGQKFTWLVWGCEFEEQRPLFEKMAHKDGTVRFFRTRRARNPATGEPMKEFQASNRPMMVKDWVAHFPQDILEDEVLVLAEPDQYMLRPLVFKNEVLAGRHDLAPGMATTQDRLLALTDVVRPGLAAAQDAFVGTKWYHMRPDELKAACGSNGNCTRFDEGQAGARYGSGPPWVLHSVDFKNHAKIWESLMIRLKTSSVSSFESEQSAYGFATAFLGLDSVLYKHYTVSTPHPGGDGFEGWYLADEIDRYDPCESRELPPADNEYTPLFIHSCGTYEANDNGTIFRIHKDHIPKDIMECKAPLLKHPSRGLLRNIHEQIHYSKERRNHINQDDLTKMRSAWMVCALTNAINAGLTSWKTQFCSKKRLNLERKATYPPYAAGYFWSSPEAHPKWHLDTLYNNGGYGDPHNKQLSGTKMNFAYPEDDLMGA